VALTLIQGYVLIGSTYLILKTEGELQKTHYRTAKLAAITTLIGAVLITIATPIFYEAARTRLFSPPLVYVFAVIPVLGVTLVALLLRSLQSGRRSYPLCLDNFDFSAHLHRPGADCVSLHHPHSNHHLPGGGSP
jgi:cytochrome d ubiquinol oxidase subunit II